ncbi:MAG: family 20 glycosylhydrolase [Clostridia bacterium]|nr:family 20 glycosylhydrolase [Clostridia bacterium]
MKIKFLGLTEDQSFGIAELRSRLSFECDDTGLAVAAVQGAEFSLRRTKDGVTLTYVRPHQFYRGISMLADFITSGEEVLTQRTDYTLLSYMADMSRNAVYNIPTAKKMIRLLALCGYDSLMLYTEDTYEMPEYPYFGYMRGRFTKAELKELDDYGYRFGIELIPCIQTLAHLNATLQWKEHNPMVDIDDILRVGADDDAVYRFIETMFKTCRECFRSRRINVGMDEAHNLGRGSYLDKYGPAKKADIMIAHLNRVVEIAKKYDFAPMIWSDMFFRMQFGGVYYVSEGSVKQEVIDLVPPEVQLIYWDYYTTPAKRQMFAHMVKCHEQFKNNKIAFAGGVSKWYGFAPINEFSINSARIQMDICDQSERMRDIIVTAWGDSGAEASQFSVLSSMLYYAERTYLVGDADEKWMDARCKQCFGIGYRELLMFDLPAEVGMTDGNRIQPSNYLLFNDPINGLMDMRMEADRVASYYRAHTEKLVPMVDHPEWGYIYDVYYRLCDVLTLKSDLSVRIRAAYKAGDRATLEAIANGEIDVIVEKLEVFWQVLRTQWLKENKSFGLDVQEIRIGGLRQRLLSAQITLRDYLAGKMEHIEELEEEQLMFGRMGCSDVFPDNPYTTYHNFNYIITACVM